MTPRPLKPKKKPNITKIAKVLTAPEDSTAELTPDLSDPEKAARVEWIIDLYSDMRTRASVLHTVAAGRQSITREGTQQIPLKSMSYQMAGKYWNLAMRILEDSMKEDMAKKIQWHRAQLVDIAKLSKKYGRMSDATAALDRVGLIDGVNNALTAAARIAATGGEAAKPLDQLSDEELLAAIAAERAKQKQRGDR